VTNAATKRELQNYEAEINRLQNLLESADSDTIRAAMAKRIEELNALVEAGHAEEFSVTILAHREYQYCAAGPEEDAKARALEMFKQEHPNHEGEVVACQKK
jgi:hypothetical protein